MLTWAPPELVNPATVEIGLSGGVYKGPYDRDAIIIFPADKAVEGTVTIKGWRNTVQIGGAIKPPFYFGNRKAGIAVKKGNRYIGPGPEYLIYEAAATGMSETVAWKQVGEHPHGALRYFDQTGIAHVEGCLIDTRKSYGMDAIEFGGWGGRRAKCRFQNIRALNISSGIDVLHADILQPYGGYASLEVDCLTGTTDYQGLFLPQHEPDYIDLRRVNIRPIKDVCAAAMLNIYNTPEQRRHPVRLRDVWIKPAPDKPKLAVMPSAAHERWAATPAVQWRDRVEWPSIPEIDGIVNLGASKKDFATAGLGYVSPGYTKLL